MSDLKNQPQHSLKGISSNTSIYYKLRQSYLIIDIEPAVDDSKRQNDPSSPSFLTNLISSRKKVDSSISNILQVIGAIAVIVIVLGIIIIQIRKCCKMYRSDDNKGDQVNKSSLLPPPSSNIVRRKTCLRR